MWSRRFALAVVLATAQATQAQQVQLPIGMDEALIPDFDRRDVKTFETDLNLDENQKTVLQSLYADYETAFQSGAQAVREQFHLLQPQVGVEDPDDEKKREDIRERMAALLEEAHRAADNMPEGADPQEIRRIYTEKMEQLRKELQQLQPRAVPREELQKMMNQASAAIDAWLIQKTRLRDEFIANLQAILHENQHDLWPPLDRKLTRQKTLNRGRLSGESVDLIALVRELKLDPAAQQAVAPALQDYEISLDAALKKRNENALPAQRDLIKSMQNNDLHGAELAVQKQTQLRLAVRKVNDEHAQIIASKLPAERAEAFNKAFKSRGYSRVFRTSHGERMFKAAKQLPDLDPATLKAVEDLERAYLGELASVNEHLLQAVREQEPDEFLHVLRRRWSGPDGESVELAVGQLQSEFLRKQELDQRYVKQLEGMLTPEQLERLPRGRSAVGAAAGNGKRDPREMNAEERKALIARFDLNHDGILDAAERDALRAFIAQEFHQLDGDAEEQPR
jgi:hypothetical protein